MSGVSCSVSVTGAGTPGGADRAGKATHDDSELLLDVAELQPSAALCKCRRVAHGVAGVAKLNQ